MREALEETLEPLRRALADRAEMAYLVRDQETASDTTRAFAAGEAHAYAVAEEQVRNVLRGDP